MCTLALWCNWLAARSSNELAVLPGLTPAMGFERSLTHLGMCIESDSACLLDFVPHGLSPELLILGCLPDELIGVTLDLFQTRG